MLQNDFEGFLCKEDMQKSKHSFSLSLVIHSEEDDTGNKT